MDSTDRSTRWNEYLQLARERPELFAQGGSGSIKILLDISDIHEVEEAMRRALQARGLPESGSQVGIIAHDPYFYLLRDAVEFPDGSRRTYTRTVYHSLGGAAVLPVLNNRIVLIRQFRHAPRQWLLEVPRGGIELGHKPEDTAHAEIREEIGGEISELILLGRFYALSNLQYNYAYLFWAKLTRIGQPQRSDGIAAIEHFSIEEFEARILNGEIRDSFTLAAFTHARLRGLL